MAGPEDFFTDLAKPQPIPADRPRVEIRKEDNPASFFQDLEEPTAPTGRQYGYGETGLLHGIHGASMGFSDEMRGISRAGGDDLGVPTPQNMIRGLAKMGYDKLTGGNEHMDEYTKARDEYRGQLEASQRQNPITATVSDVAGSMVAPGGSMLKGATMGARALRGAAVSGIQGGLRGAGEAKEMEDIPKSTAEGTAIGATIGAPINMILGPRGTNITQQALKQVADKYGVQLPYYMVSDNPIVQFYGKGMDQIPFFGPAASKAAKKAREGVQGIRDDLVESGAGHGATPTEARTTATDAARNAQREFIDNSKTISEANYSAVTGAMANPKATMMPTAMQTEAADQLTKIGAYGGTPSKILNQAIASSETAIDRGGLTYQALKDLRSSIYEDFKRMETRGGMPYADYVKIVGAITKDMENIVHGQGGSKAVDLWNKANAQHGIGKDIGKEITTAIGTEKGNTAAADAIFRHINDTRPNIGAVNTLRNTMRPNEWEKVQSSIVARMGGDDAGNFSMQKFITANKNMSDAGRDAVFGMAGTPKRDAYDAVLKLGQSIQGVERYANYSGTAPMMLGAGAALQLIDDYRTGNYFKTTGELGAGAVLAAILARPATARSATVFSKVMDKYLNTPAMWTAGKVPRAVEIAARNFAISLANGTGIDRDKLVSAFTAPTPLWNQ